MKKTFKAILCGLIAAAGIVLSIEHSDARYAIVAIPAAVLIFIFG